MPTEAERRLAELEQKYTAEDRLADLEAKYGKTEPERGFIESLADVTSRPFNEGLISLAEILPGGGNLRQSTDVLGLTSPEGQGADNIVADSARIIGETIGPLGAVGTVGRGILKTTLPAARRGLSDLAVQASKPGSIASEILAAFGAGTGGQIAEGISDSPNAKQTGQLIGGVSAATAPLARSVAGQVGDVGALLPQKVTDAIKGVARYLPDKAAALADKTPVAGPLIRASGDVAEGFRGAINPYYRAAKELQSRHVDPIAAADQVDVASPMPPARQTGESRALALEQALRKRSSPAAVEKVDRHIAQTVGAAEKKAIAVGGDITAPRAIIKQDALKAVNEAETALAKVNPGADPGDISADVRGKLDAAQKAARGAEKEAWEKVGFESPGNYANTEETLTKIMAETGRPLADDAIPGAVTKELAAAADGATLRDIHALRQKVQGLKGAAQLDPEKRATVRWLAQIEESLLADMDAVDTADPQALVNARNITKDLYDRFRRGKMGEVLGYSERSRQAVASRDTMDRIFSGREIARDLEQMIGAAPETRQEGADYVRSLFTTGAAPDGKVNPAKANTLINRLRTKRIFEVFPELEGELTEAVTKGVAGETLLTPGEIIPRNMKKSLTAMFLDKPPGKETSMLLDKKLENAPQRARQLLARMKGNKAGEDGLRQSFRESLWDGAKSGLDPKGKDLHSARQFTRLVNDNIKTMEALGFGKDDIQNMRHLATTMRQAQAQPKQPDISEDIFTDIPGMILNKASRLFGARLGNWTNRVLGGVGAGDAGPSLQAAGMGSGTAADIAAALRVDPAERLLLDAMDNPTLFKALLLRGSAGEAAKKEAAGRLNAWAVSVGLSDEESQP